MIRSRAKASNRPTSFNENAPVPRQLDDIRRVVGQLWEEKNRMLVDVEAILNNVDLDVSTKRILELLANKWGHTSEMPDEKGLNKDHDLRYHSRKEAMWQFRRLQPLVSKSGQAIVAKNKQNVTVDTGAGV